MKRRWTEEEIWDWYREHEWITGFNFIPSNSMTGSVYYFQSYHHEEAFKDAAKELALAAFLKFNSIRVSLPFDVWRQEHDQFFASMDELLEVKGVTPEVLEKLKQAVTVEAIEGAECSC